MANFQANFHSLIKQRFPLDVFVKELNHSLYRIINGEKFLTLFIAEFDKKTQELRYINAGHNPPILVMNDEAHLLKKGCTILGSFSEIPVIEVGTIQLDNDAVMVTFTDGLTLSLIHISEPTRPY